jgi:hypothetical protein
MKNYNKYLLASVLILMAGCLDAQVINWGSLKKENRHILNVNTGIEHGAIFGAAYGYHLKSKAVPVVLAVEYSFPAGNTLLDDFKAKIGGQARWIKTGGLQFSTRIQGVFRRYENDLARLINFGCDLAGVVGYYRTNWFMAAEVGFDKAIVTNLKHKKAYKDQYPNVVDGWYEPATGGNLITSLSPSTVH